VNKRVLGLLIGACLTVAGQNRPPEQMEVFRAASEALANQDAAAFLDQFDPKMPQYEKLRDEIQDLFGVAQEIGSTIDVITDEGVTHEDEGQKRTLELDWLLKIDNDEPRRQIVKCQVEKQGKKWKITALEPVEFFRGSVP
jgi:murein L,D-transpeptidase YcbB/YkuD